MTNLHRDIENAAAELERATRNAADTIAGAHNSDNADTVALIAEAYRRRFHVDEGGTMDGRNRRYLIHIAIFDSRNLTDARGDSRWANPEGAVVAGLPAVWREIVDTCRAWHAAEGHLDDGGQLIGLSDGDLKIRGLRPTLSRHAKAVRLGFRTDPSTAWRTKYQTFDNVGGKGGWIVRCDLLPLDKED